MMSVSLPPQVMWIWWGKELWTFAVLFLQTIKFDVYIGTTPLPVTVTTRIVTFLIGNPYKPSFTTVTGWGVDLMYINWELLSTNFACSPNRIITSFKMISILIGTVLHVWHCWLQMFLHLSSHFNVNNCRMDSESSGLTLILMEFDDVKCI